MVQAGGYSAAYVWRRCREVEPKLALKREVLKRALSARTRQLRYTIAKRSMRYSMRTLMRVVWLDEGRVFLRPKPRLYVGLKGEEYLREDARLNTGRGTGGQISYMLAVNGIMGLVYCGILSCSTGVDPALKYKVSGSQGHFIQSLRATLLLRPYD